MAFEEGLLEVNRLDTDGVFDRFKNKTVPIDLKILCLEQISITPSIMLYNIPLFEKLKGNLIDNNYITNNSDQVDHGIKFEQFPMSFVVGMLESKGMKITEQDGFKAIEELKKINIDQEKYINKIGKEPPSTASYMVDEVMKLVNWKNFTPSYTIEEKKKFDRINKRYKKIRPIINTITEFIKIAALAEKYNALLKVPVATSNYSIGNQYMNEVAIIRIASKELGRFHYRPTIKDTLKLSNEPASIAFREILAEWSEAIIKGDIGDIIFFQNEIKRANSALDKLNQNYLMNTVFTYLSIPVSALEYYLQLPPIISSSIAVIGTTAQIENKIVTNKYNWAMFNSK
ncbi:hypothetical protein [Spirosoma migulaei]